MLKIKKLISGENKGLVPGHIGGSEFLWLTFSFLKYAFIKSWSPWSRYSKTPLWINNCTFGRRVGRGFFFLLWLFYLVPGRRLSGAIHLGLGWALHTLMQNGDRGYQGRISVDIREFATCYWTDLNNIKFCIFSHSNPLASPSESCQAVV